MGVYCLICSANIPKAKFNKKNKKIVLSLKSNRLRKLKTVSMLEFSPESFRTEIMCFPHCAKAMLLINVKHIG